MYEKYYYNTIEASLPPGFGISPDKDGIPKTEDRKYYAAHMAAKPFQKPAIPFPRYICLNKYVVLPSSYLTLR